MKEPSFTELVANEEFDKVPWESLTQEDIQSKDRFLNTLLLYAAHHWVWKRVPKELLTDENLLEPNPVGVRPLDRIIQNISDQEDFKDFKNLLKGLKSQTLDHIQTLGFKNVGKAALKEKARRLRRVVPAQGLDLSM